ncbi:MAG: hypothetical protein HYT30_01860 [Parcubacteria group bacterium]|nr:hypothetical protein [Parcubacteria group bacterium]
MYKNIFMVIAGVVLMGATASVAQADHAWGPYHWARTSNPFTIKLGDNVSGVWDATLAQASSDWSASAVLDTTIVPGSNLRSPKTCRPKAGQGEVCNAKYGNNGWLGIASIWASGDHITQGTVKLNDTYFNTPTYNTPAWRNLVTCQEVGHIFGLDHQDENFTNANLGTCMDYTNNPVDNQHPNAHDYEMLETIYAHLDTTTTVSQTAASSARMPDIDTENRSEWGREIRRSADGRAALFERDLGNGRKVFTHVFWAEGAPVRGVHAE